MDVFLLLFVCVGLTYLFIRGVRWAVRLDGEEARKRERVRRRKDRRQVKEAFEDIIRPLRKQGDA